MHIIGSDIVLTILVIHLHISWDRIAIVGILLALWIRSIGDLPDADLLVVVVHADGLADEPTRSNVIHRISLFVIDAHIDNLRVVVSKVERRGPGEVLLHDVGAVDLQFPTRAFGLATVFGDVARTVDGRDGTIEQQVLGARPIGVERTRDAVVQEREIHAEVYLLGRFPSKGRRS